jgi:two-component system sensor histidine kinase AlgZ
VVEIDGRRDSDMLHITITNPMPTSGSSARSGNQMALENVGERLALAFGGEARLEVDPGPGRFRVHLAFPYQPARR